MKAQIVLTPTEAKKLISKAIVQIPEVRRALKEGLVVMHPSTSTYFIFEELIGKPPETEVWVCGTIVKKGFCVECGAYSNTYAHRNPGFISAPGHFSFSWIIKGRELQPSKTIDELCQQLGEKDVYIKGVNAVDPANHVGVLIGSLAEGTIGRIVTAKKKNNFAIVYPVGLEKLIPIPIEVASKAIGSNRDIEYSMGLSCALMPVPGTTVTEVDAFRILTGLHAVPISSGGLAGAEGATILLLTGEKAAVYQGVQLAESVKGAQMRQVKNPNCEDCRHPTCRFVGIRNERGPWLQHEEK